MTAPQPRLPLAPLWSLVRAQVGLPDHDPVKCPCMSSPTSQRHDPRHQAPMAQGNCFSVPTFANAIGTTARAIERWKAEGGFLPLSAADGAALHLGLHPALIWGDYELEIDDDEYEQMLVDTKWRAA